MWLQDCVFAFAFHACRIWPAIAQAAAAKEAQLAKAVLTQQLKTVETAKAEAEKKYYATILNMQQIALAEREQALQQAREQALQDTDRMVQEALKRAQKEHNHELYVMREEADARFEARLQEEKNRSLSALEKERRSASQSSSHPQLPHMSVQPPPMPTDAFAAGHGDHLSPSTDVVSEGASDTNGSVAPGSVTATSEIPLPAQPSVTPILSFLSDLSAVSLAAEAAASPHAAASIDDASVQANEHPLPVVEGEVVGTLCGRCTMPTCVCGWVMTCYAFFDQSSHEHVHVVSFFDRACVESCAIRYFVARSHLQRAHQPFQPWVHLLFLQNHPLNISARPGVFAQSSVEGVKAADI